MLILSVDNFILLLLKAKRRGYFYFNTIFQLPVAFVLTGVGATAPVGIPLL